jgi:hypothetical protein
MKHILSLMTCLLLLSSCASAPNSGGLTPLPGATDLPDAKLKEAITQYLKDQKAPPNSEYDFIRNDLNGDRARDGIVLFKLPHTYWCGWDGCGMTVFKAGASTFTPISTIRNVRGPIYVSSNQNNGWKDIIIRVSGTNMADKNVVLRNKGGAYPTSPLTAPDLSVPLNTIQKQRYFR